MLNYCNIRYYASLHDVYEMNAYRTDPVCLSVRPSVCMVQIKNTWTDLDEISCGRYAIGVCRIIVIFNFLQSMIPTFQTNELLRWDRHKFHLQLDP
jgi:hypothetical protein